MLSSNCHATLRLTVLEIFAVKWLFRGPKIDPPLPFFVSHLTTPKDIITRREKSCPYDRSTVEQTFTSIGCTVAEIGLSVLVTDIHTQTQN